MRKRPLDLRAAIAEHAALWRQARAAYARSLGAEEVGELLVGGTGVVGYLRSMRTRDPEPLFLLLLLTPEANLGQARLAARRLLDRAGGGGMAYLTGLSALGVDQAVFTGMDGLVIEALGQGPPSAEALAAELAALARRMDPLAQALGGKVLRFTLATEDREVLAVRVGEFLLGAVVHRGLNRKAVGQELSRIALRLEEAWREG